jgi:hypothetical protein
MKNIFYINKILDNTNYFIKNLIYKLFYKIL